MHASVSALPHPTPFSVKHSNKAHTTKTHFCKIHKFLGGGDPPPLYTRNLMPHVRVFYLTLAGYVAVIQYKTI